jgi:hypothetical protein
MIELLRGCHFSSAGLKVKSGRRRVSQYALLPALNDPCAASIDRTNVREMVDQTCGSLNRLLEWLRGIEALKPLT